jgi:hypothetical protein
MPKSNCFTSYGKPGSARRAALAVAGLVLSCAAHGQAREPSVKAAFIYNFTKFVTWPADAFPSPNSPIVISIVGTDTLDGELENVVEGKEVGDRPFVIRHISWKDAENCNVLFVPTPESDHQAAIAKLKSHHVLVIGDSPGFIHKGGMINLVLEGTRVRFEISAQNAKEAGITISSRLLSLAKSAD